MPIAPAKGQAETSAKSANGLLMPIKQPDQTPSALEISVVFGGALGMIIFALLDLSAGLGFLFGAGSLFAILLGLTISHDLSRSARRT